MFERTSFIFQTCLAPSEGIIKNWLVFFFSSCQLSASDDLLKFAVCEDYLLPSGLCVILNVVMAVLSTVTSKINFQWSDFTTTLFTGPFTKTYSGKNLKSFCTAVSYINLIEFNLLCSECNLYGFKQNSFVVKCTDYFIHQLSGLSISKYMHGHASEYTSVSNICSERKHCDCSSFFLF